MRRLCVLATLALVGAAAVSNSSSTATSATTTVASAPPSPGRPMQWFRSHAATRSVERGAADFGSTAVIGLRSMRDLASLRRFYGFETVQAMPDLRAARVDVDATQLHALLAHATSDRRLRYVAPLGPPRQLTDVANEPLVQNVDPKTKLPYEWQYASANLAGALALTAGDPRIQVGVIDTGVDAVPDLAGKVDGLYDVTAHGTQLSPSTAGNDDYGHGTAVASLIAANGFGMAGFGGAAHVIGIHADNQGRFYDADLAEAIAKLDALGVRIVNLSIGGPEPSSPILVDAIDKAASDGMLIVAASGNDSGPVDWPAALLQPSGGGESYGLAVGATNVTGGQASFSNFGEHLSLVAPGIFRGNCSGVLVALPQRSRLLSDTCYPQWTGPGGAEYGYVAGTSFASPEVAGVAALVWAVRPELKNYQVADILKASADRDVGTGWTPTTGCGRLDAAAAVTLALSRTAAEWASVPPSAAGPCTAASVAPPALPHTQTITFKPIPDRTTADGDFDPNAHASSGLPVTYTAYGGCTVRHGTVHVFAASLCWITAHQDGNDRIYAARPVLQVVAITDAVIPVALPAEGTAGRLVNLRYRSTTLGIVATDIVVDRNGRPIAHVVRNASVVDQGGLYSIAWHAPRAAAHGSLRFCVTLRNRTPGAPTRSYTSCAHIRLVARTTERKTGPAADGAVSTKSGELAAWGCGGANDDGQCRVPTLAPGSLVAIAAGTAHTLALTNRGVVIVWGCRRGNDYGQCRVPASARRGVTAISAGAFHSLALTTNGRVLAWGCKGLIDAGQCRVPVSAEHHVIAISAGQVQSLALTSTGRVIAWGCHDGNDSGQCTVPPAAQQDVIAIAAGSSHSLALTGDGRVIAWGCRGNNNDGQCRVPRSARRNVIAIAAGSTYSLALTGDGEVVAWGCNGIDFGQCAVPDAARKGITAVAAGVNHSLALTKSGRVIAWGCGDDYGMISSNFGQCSVPAAARRGISAISAGYAHSLALKAGA